MKRFYTRSLSSWALLARLLVVPLASVGAAGCGPAGPTEASWPPLGKKWFERAKQSYRHGDIEDAELAVENALRIVPERDEVKLLAGRIALAQLEYDRTLQHLKGLQSSDARALRGRALWYSGRIDKAADELEALLSDPEVRDDWASGVAKLARRGSGRKPFTMSGGLLGVTEMARMQSSALVVPLELNGEQALGMIATGTAETVVDGTGGPKWVSLRFGERVEVKDVPALSQDLSGVSRQLNAPIKVLLGVNLLRHLRPTFDFTGSQFVVRSFEPPPPPAATTVRLSYVRGGGMLMRGALGTEKGAPMASFLVDTTMTFPLALDEGAWKKADVALSSLKEVPSQDGLKQGTLPILRLGAFEIPEIPGVLGVPIAEWEKLLDIDLDGVVGSGLLAAFRVTLIDGGRAMWLEDMPMEAVMGKRSGEPAPGPAAPAAPGETPDLEGGKPAEDGKPHGDGTPAGDGTPPDGASDPRSK